MFDDQTASNSGGNDGRDSKARAMNYLVEVFLDENKYVRRTRIYHVQSGQEATWDNWDEARLLAFFKQRPELRLTKPPQAAKNAQPDQIEEVKSAEIKAEPVAASASSSATTVSTGTETGPVKNALGAPRLHKMEIVPDRSGLPSRAFNHKQAFNVRLYLDLAEMKLSGRGSHDYSVVVLARRMGAERQQEFIKEQGTITSNSDMTLNLKWPPLPSGTYRISAAVTISPKDTSAAPQDEFTASLVGGLYKVY